MSHTLETAGLLAEEIKKSNEYLRYHHLLEELSRKPKLLAAVNDFRKRRFLLEISEANATEAERELGQLREINETLLCDSKVRDFFIAERQLSLMIQKILSMVSEAADLDLDFLG